jgi:mRNA-degrading endonuclease RelE of RelBE toxin-antitoxin system
MRAVLGRRLAIRSPLALAIEHLSGREQIGRPSAARIEGAIASITSASKMLYSARRHAMPHSSTSAAGSYRVTFSAEAWKRIGMLPHSTFQALQAALDDVANTLGSGRPSGEHTNTELRAQAAGLSIVYQRDDATRTITLVDFLPAPSASTR